MNRIYKVIWNKAKGCYQVASEFAHQQGRGGSSKSAAGRMAAVLAVTALLGGVSVQAAVVSGDSLSVQTKLQNEEDNYIASVSTGGIVIGQGQGHATTVGAKLPTTGIAIVPENPMTGGTAKMYVYGGATFSDGAYNFKDGIVIGDPNTDNHYTLNTGTVTTFKNNFDAVKSDVATAKTNVSGLQTNYDVLSDKVTALEQNGGNNGFDNKTGNVVIGGKVGTATPAVTNAVVAGNGAKADTAAAVVVGSNASAGAGTYGSVVLGRNSAVVYDDILHNANDTQSLEPTGVVSVGNSGKNGQPAFNRRIINVAEGKNATDAVNKGQLDTVNAAAAEAKTASDANTTKLTALDASAVKWDNAKDGSVGNTITKNGSKLLLSTDTAGLTNGKANVTLLGNSASVTVGQKGFTVSQDGTKVTGGLNVDNSKITNVAAGKAETDAVNVKQLSDATKYAVQWDHVAATGQKLNSITGNGATLYLDKAGLTGITNNTSQLVMTGSTIGMTNGKSSVTVNDQGILLNGNTTVTGKQFVTGGQWVNGNQVVTGTSTVNEQIVKNSQTVEGDSTVKGSQNVLGTQSVMGGQWVNGNQTVTGTSTVNEQIVKNSQTVEGDSTVKGSQNVLGTQSVMGGQWVNGNQTVTGTSTVNEQIVKNSQTVEGDSTVKGNQYVTGAQSVGSQWVVGNQVVGGNSEVDGNSTIKGNQTVDKDLSVKGDAVIDGSSTVKGNQYVTGAQTVGNQWVVGNQVVGGKFEVDGYTTLKGGLDVSNNKIANVAAGVNDTDAVNKGQLDAVNTELTGKTDGLKETLGSADFSRTAYAKGAADVTDAIYKVDTQVQTNAETLKKHTEQITAAGDLAKKHTTVVKGDNIELSEGKNADGGKEYTVSLAKDITVDKVTVNGEVKANSANLGGVEIDGGNINAATASIDNLGVKGNLSASTATITNLGVENNIYAKLGTIGGVGLENGTVTADKVQVGSVTLSNTTDKDAAALAIGKVDDHNAFSVTNDGDVHSLGTVNGRDFQNNSGTFVVDKDGNLTAASGTIGGVELGNSNGTSYVNAGFIYSEGLAVGNLSGDPEKAPFYVAPTGHVTAYGADMSGQKITGVANGTEATDAVNYGQLTSKVNEATKGVVYWDEKDENTNKIHGVGLENGAVTADKVQVGSVTLSNTTDNDAAALAIGKVDDHNAFSVTNDGDVHSLGTINGRDFQNNSGTFVVDKDGNLKAATANVGGITLENGMANGVLLKDGGIMAAKADLGNVQFNGDGRISNLAAAEKDDQAVNYGQMKGSIQAATAGSVKWDEGTTNTIHGVTLKDGEVKANKVTADEAFFADGKLVVDKDGNLFSQGILSVGQSYLGNTASYISGVTFTSGANGTAVRGLANAVTNSAADGFDGSAAVNVNTLNSVVKEATKNQVTQDEKGNVTINGKLTAGSASFANGATTIDENGIKTNNLTVGNTTIGENGITVNGSAVATSKDVEGIKNTIGGSGENGALKLTNNAATVEAGINKNTADIAATNKVIGATGEKGALKLKNGADTVEKGINQNTADIQQNREAINSLGRGLSDLGEEVDNVGAISAALAGLHPLDYDGSGSKFQISAAVGTYDGTQAAALGGFYHFNRDVMMSLGASSSFGSDNKTAANLGVTFRVGQGADEAPASNSAIMERLAAMDKKIAELEAQNKNLTSVLAVIDPSQQKAFPDVPENHWAYDAVAQLAGNGIVQGYPDGEFHGDRTMTRYEMAELIYKAMKKGAKVDQKLVNEFKTEISAAQAKDNAEAAKAAETKPAETAETQAK
ncbi:ESPR-type extended signal peptide-containing protein [uncultured Megasphaera sp.]|uniref:ESPR-type extended signal peptide-containing protein n=1 Tax=uncultured Megasphaera sp. TaxID=165188 RepID=UPI00265B6D2E|nr:ESPR-type extended signal peptide-containing protein [uncultured Megasphaera sp.]